MVTLDTRFDEKNQLEEWKNEVAMDLNTLLERARYFRETSNDETDKELERVTLRVVERVAAFEEIAVEGADLR
jgi:hypothetical protein